MHRQSIGSLMTDWCGQESKLKNFTIIQLSNRWASASKHPYVLSETRWSTFVLPSSSSKFSWHLFLWRDEQKWTITDRTGLIHLYVKIEPFVLHVGTKISHTKVTMIAAAFSADSKSNIHSSKKDGWHEMKWWIIRKPSHSHQCISNDQKLFTEGLSRFQKNAHTFF